MAERDLAAVEPFVNGMGDQMNYRVALDDQNKMAKAWLDAAGINGIPTAFVVGRDSKIAWIGSPDATGHRSAPPGASSAPHDKTGEVIHE